MGTTGDRYPMVLRIYWPMSARSKRDGGRSKGVFLGHGLGRYAPHL